MDSMDYELKILARWEKNKKQLLAKQKAEREKHDKVWGDTLAGYRKSIKGNQDLEDLLKKFY